MQTIKVFLTLVFLIYNSALFGQFIKSVPPNYDRIEKNIQDSSSNFFYPKLMKSFLAGDSSMTLDEKRHLYYGQIFQGTYSPYFDSPFSDSLANIFAKKSLETKDYDNIIRYTDEILYKSPLDLRTINKQLFAYEKMFDEAKFKRNLNRMRIVVDAIFSSGDGISKETAFYVINVAHEYDMLGILGFNYGGEQSLIEHYDYLTVEENKEKIKGMYFDISPSLNHLKKSFGNLQFNIDKGKEKKEKKKRKKKKDDKEEKTEE